MGILATSQITIVDLNDQISLSSYLTSNTAKVQFLSTNGTYTPNFSSAPITLTAEIYKIGNNTNIIGNPEVKSVKWFVKIGTATSWTEITASDSNYQLVANGGKNTHFKIINNVMNKSNPLMAVQCQIAYQESWMPDAHIQKSEIDFSLSVQGDTGAAGTNAYTVVLSNEAHAIICDPNGLAEPGELGSTGRAFSDITVYKGATKLTPVAESATPGNNQFKYRILESNSCTAVRTDDDTFRIESLPQPSAYLGTITETDGAIDGVDGNKGYLATAAVSESGYVKVEIICENSQTLTKMMTFTKVKQGQNGSNGTDGENGAPAKYINISSTAQVFKYGKNEATPIPTSIVLAAESYNIDVTKIIWKQKSLDDTWVDASGTNNLATYTVSPTSTDFNARTSVTYRCYVNDIYTDEVTISKIIDGEDSYTVILTNESHSIACDPSGNPKSGELDKTVSDVIVYRGVNKLTGATSATVGNFKYSIGTITPSGGATVTKVDDDTFKITAISADNVTAEITVECEGFQTIKKLVTYTKSKDGQTGAAGTPAKVVTIAGEQTFKYAPNYTGTPVPTSITLNRAMQGVSGGKWQHFDGSAWVDFNPAQTGATIEVTHNMANTLFSNIANKQLRVRYVASDNTTYDEHTLVKLTDGLNGTDGIDGTNAYTVILTNESHTCVADSNGNVSADELAKAKSEIQAFKGTANATFTVSIVTAETVGCTAAWESNNLVIKTLTADSAKAVVDIRVDNAQTIRKAMTVTKSRKGETGQAGANALAIDISGEQVFAYNAAGVVAPSKINLTATPKNFTATSSNIKWEIMNGNSVVATLTGAGGTTSPDITPTTTGWQGDVLKVRATYTGNANIYDEHTITKVRDGSNPIVAYIWAPAGNTIKNDDRAKIDLEAVLYWGNEDKTQSSGTSYTWYKVAPNGTETVIKAAASGANGYKCSVTADDIPNILTVKCKMTYSGQNISDTIVLNDLSDPIQAVIFSTAGDTFKNNAGTTYLKCRLIRDGEELDPIEIYDSVPATSGVAAGTIIFVKPNKYKQLVNSAWVDLTEPPSTTNGKSKYTYTWTRWNENGVADNTNFGTGKIVQVTSDNVNQKANFTVQVDN